MSISQSFVEWPVVNSSFRFVHQYDEEYEDVKKNRRPGRPANSREDLLKMKITALEKEQTDGFCEYLPLFSPQLICDVRTKFWVDMPDLTTEKNVQMLDRWEGSWAYLSNLEWVKITASGTVRSCNFPPQTN